MELICKGRNLYIINKIPRTFEKIQFEEKQICLQDEKSILTENIYACLHCKELRNITLIVKDNQVYGITLMFEERDEFSKILKNLQEWYPFIEISRQNKKINGYAAAVIEKLRVGIETGIVNTDEQKEVKCCPVCGMQCDPNIPYCMECGSEV